jgi:hypothetical protein
LLVLSKVKLVVLATVHQRGVHKYAPTLTSSKKQKQTTKEKRGAQARPLQITY